MSRGMCAERLIVALDYTALGPAVTMARTLRGGIRTVKIGSALFTACGPEIVARIRALGFRVMLDLKFFDIPSTVELSCVAAARQRVSLLTVHAEGGRTMLKAAVRGARAGARSERSRPLIVAVTVLTSTPPPAAIRGGPEAAGGQRDITRLVLERAEAAKDAGCDGVVASVQEAREIQRAFRSTLKIVCPGIRPAGSFRGDQRRVGTPAAALAAGADWLVVGRPITAARHPRAAAESILREMERVNGC